MTLTELGEIVIVFTQLGLTSFGGPAASIALMQQWLVQRRKWLNQEEFMDFVAASHLIPGPIAVQLSLHLGYRRAGLPGALAAVVGFVIPAAVITWLCAILYVRSQNLPFLEACLRGARPAILVVILVSLGQIAQERLFRLVNIFIFSAVAIAYLLGGNPFAVLIVGTFGSLFVVRAMPPKDRRGSPGENHRASRTQPPPTNFSSLGVGTVPNFAAGLTLGASSGLSPGKLFVLFAKVGLFLYGGGNVLAAYLTAELVKSGIITHQQLLDALAVGQSTPGPILTVATFLGYVLGGPIGAIAATAGIITPSVFLALLLHPYVRVARANRWTAAFLDSLTLVVIGLILGVCIELGRQVFTEPATVILGAFSLWAATFGKVSPLRLILATALIGLLIWG